MTEPPDLTLPSRITLADPAPFLSAITATPWFHENLDRLEAVDMWALVALCALSRREISDSQRCDVYHRGKSNAGRFAHAIGFDAARDGDEPSLKDQSRTFPIQRVAIGASARHVAGHIARLAVPNEKEVEAREVLEYVIEELLRNVLQHSGDALGAVVGAQRMDARRSDYKRATVQVAVVDTGKGIVESLRRFHDVEDAEVALEKALRPHVSGTFPEGQTGSIDNAGLGLFFTSEMAKLTDGRLLLATRGAALLLSTDEEAGTHQMEFLQPRGTGFPGTLAVFELPLDIEDRELILGRIRELASERTPAPTTRSWLSYEHPPPSAELFVVRDWADDARAATILAETLRSRLATQTPVALDFSGIGISTQSFLHALLFHAVRIGWAMGARVYIVNASAAVRSGLDYLESYALK